VIDHLFLSVGAMKASTSWLYKQLENHPDIYSTPVKEIHYFAHTHTNITFLDFNAKIATFKTYFRYLDAQSNAERVSRDLRWFASYLEDPVDDNWFIKLFAERGTHKYCAEYSNLISTLDDATWKHILGIAKNVKVVYTLRDPLSRLWSHTRFHHAVNKTEGALSSWSAEKFRKYFVSEGLISHGMYYSNILRMRGHLTDDQLMIFFFEDFRRDPALELRRVETFLDISHIDYSPEDLEVVHNPSPPLPMPETFIEAACEFIEPELEQLELLNLKTPESWYCLERLVPLSPDETGIVDHRD